MTNYLPQIPDFTMGKPSLKSRKTSQARKKKRFMKQIKSREEEVSDLQIQMQDFKKNVEDVGKTFFKELNKCSRENDNLAKWLKIYDKQINDYREEIYNLNSKLYFSSQTSQLSSQSQQPQPPPHQPHQPQSPTYKSLADYFDSQK